MGRPKKNQDPVDVVNEKLETGEIPTEEEIDACPQGAGKDALKEILKGEPSPLKYEREDTKAVREVLKDAKKCVYPTLVDCPMLGSLREYRLVNIDVIALTAAWSAYKNANPLGSYAHFFDIIKSITDESPEYFKIVNKLSL